MNVNMIKSLTVVVGALIGGAVGYTYGQKKGAKAAYDNCETILKLQYEELTKTMLDELRGEDYSSCYEDIALLNRYMYLCREQIIWSK